MSPRTKVDLDQIAEKCPSLKLTHVAETLPELLEQSNRDDLAPVRFLELVLEPEIEIANMKKTLFWI